MPSSTVVHRNAELTMLSRNISSEDAEDRREKKGFRLGYK